MATEHKLLRLWDKTCHHQSHHWEQSDIEITNPKVFTQIVEFCDVVCLSLWVLAWDLIMCRPDTPAVLIAFSPLASLFIGPEAQTLILYLLEQLLLVCCACADELLSSYLVPEIKTMHLICHSGFYFTINSTQDMIQSSPQENHGKTNVKRGQDHSILFSQH